MENRDRCVIVLRVLAKREYTSQKYQLTESNLAYLGGSLKSHAKFQSDVYKSRALSLLPPLYPSRFGASRLRYIADIGTRAPGNGPFPLSSSSPFSLLSLRGGYDVWTNVCVYTVCPGTGHSPRAGS
ncbi:hypothetical protein ACS0PU_005502 [Formica fusca]